MPLPTWPATVPYEVMPGWSMPEPYLKPLATEMEGGNKILRRRPGDNVAVVDYPLKPLTRAQFSDFENFARNTLFNGTSRFTMQVWLGGNYVSKTVQLEDGMFSASARGNDFVSVSFKLRVYGM